MFCSKCGSEISESWMSCPKCGEATPRQIVKSYPTSVSQPAQGLSTPEYYQVEEDKEKGLLALIFGINGLILPVLGIVALIYGIMGRKNDKDPSRAEIGLFLGILEIAIMVMGVIIMAILFSTM